MTRQTVRRWSRWNGLTDILLVDSGDKSTRGSSRAQVASDQDPEARDSILADCDIPAVLAVVDASACDVDRDVRRAILAWRAAFWRTSSVTGGTEVDAAHTGKEPIGTNRFGEPESLCAIPHSARCTLHLPSFD